MTRDAKKIVDAWAHAFASIAVGSPEAGREAARWIRSSKFSCDQNVAHQSAINAIAHMIEQRAEARERMYRHAFGGK